MVIGIEKENVVAGRNVHGGFLRRIVGQVRLRQLRQTEAIDHVLELPKQRGLDGYISPVVSLANSSSPIVSSTPQSCT